MVDPQDIHALKRQIEGRREALVKLRNNLNESWRALQVPEVEPEESGQKGWTAQGIDTLDRQAEEEIEDEIRVRLRDEERLDTQELDLSVRRGMVILEGFVPSATEHRMLTELLEGMGVGRVEDRVSENPLLWDRGDRSAPPRAGKSDEDVLLQGEDVDQDTFESMKDGSSVPPPDTLIPEGEE